MSEISNRDKIRVEIARDYKEYIEIIFQIERYFSSKFPAENQKISDSYNENKQSIELWFRGVSNASYNLEPGLYYSEKVKSLECNESVNPILRDFYEDFVIGSSRFIDRELIPTPGTHYEELYSWLPTMQHYGAPTNLLDFSKMADIALYFAIEKYLFYSKKNNPDLPCVWILAPHALNLKNSTELSKVFFEDNSNKETKEEESDETPEPNYFQKRIPSLWKFLSIPGNNEIINCHCAVRSTYDSRNIRAQAGVFVNFPVDIRRDQLINNKLDMLEGSDEYLAQILLVRPRKITSEYISLGESAWAVYPNLSIVGQMIRNNL